jgi:hypothetical protein
MNSKIHSFLILKNIEAKLFFEPKKFCSENKKKQFRVWGIKIGYVGFPEPYIFFILALYSNFKFI